MEAGVRGRVRHAPVVFDRMVMIVATKFAETVLVMNFEKGEWPVVDKLAISLLLTALRRFVSKYCRFPYERFRSMPPPPPPYQQLARATAEHALADAEAEGDDLAAVDVNLVLTFLAARDGDLDDALRRYKAAVQKDPSDSRPYELVVAAALGSGTLTTLGLERGGRGRLVLVAAWREVDARLAAAVLDDDLDLTLPERRRFSGVRGGQALSPTGGRASAQIRRPKQQQKVAAKPPRRVPATREHATAGRAAADQPAAAEGCQLAKTAAGEASRSTILSGSADRPCCTFFASPAKAAKQEHMGS
uniref:Uncharacterized protein n=1 Tax=Oryza meridionalis TaxID=40149 RepID=A0A0E0EDY0_9ORYZ